MLFGEKRVKSVLWAIHGANPYIEDGCKISRFVMKMVTIGLLKLYILPAYNAYNTKTIRGEIIEKTSDYNFYNIIGGGIKLEYCSRPKRNRNDDRKY